jgi:hypothetical protein
MVEADEEVVRSVLAPYETKLFRAVHDAWDEWKALELGGRLLFPARSRACLVHDFMVQRACAAFSGDSAVRVIRRDETAKFVFADQVLLRFKKADDTGLGSNIETQATLNFVEQQQELPGIPNVHKVEAVYILNKLSTQIERIVVVARDGDVRLWDYVIAPATTAEIVTLPLVGKSQPERGAKVKVRSADEGQKKDAGE